MRGDDPTYLREVQYKDGSNLTSRANLHAKYGTSKIGWFDWVAQQIEWPANGAVLEVGCGTGWLWDAVDTPIKMTLTDLSPGMVALAAERVGARAVVADAQALPFDDDSFDVVVANHMLYHVPDIPAAVRELRRVLRADGVLVAATNGLDSLRELTELRGKTPGYAKRFGRENGDAILRESFGDVTWHTYDDELRCTDPDDVVAYIASMAPGEIGPAEAAALRTAITERMVEGVFRVTKDTGAFIARHNAQP